MISYNFNVDFYTFKGLLIKILKVSISVLLEIFWYWYHPFNPSLFGEGEFWLLYTFRNHTFESSIWMNKCPDPLASKVSTFQKSNLTLLFCFSVFKKGTKKRAPTTFRSFLLKPSFLFRKPYMRMEYDKENYLCEFRSLCTEMILQ